MKKFLFSGIYKITLGCDAGKPRLLFTKGEPRFKRTNETCSEGASPECSSPECYITCPGAICGHDRLRRSGLNKELAFTIEERQTLGIHGLLPPLVLTQDDQIEWTNKCYDRLPEDLDKHIFLSDLLARNEKLFFAFFKKYTEKVLPIVYTPFIAEVCLNYGLMYRRPRGLFITIHDKGRVYKVLSNWHENEVRAICVTDGGRILGLGDQGANGMAIPIGKLTLYTAMGGVWPQQCLPITLDVGTNNEKLLKDPKYVGIREKRVRGEQYYEFVDEFMEAVARRWGCNTLVQFEDFESVNAFYFKDKYKSLYCTFNDDIEGTAAVCLAGLLVSTKITKRVLSENVFLFCGAGGAGVGIAELLKEKLINMGVPEDKVKASVWLFDIDGVVTNKRKAGINNKRLEYFSKNCKPTKNLLEVVKMAKPTVLIGTSAQGGAFTPEVLEEMVKITERPVIFALSNPTCQAECTAKEAYEHTDGKVLYASGSPMPPVTYNGKTYQTAQCNNSYVFPGLGLATTTVGIRNIHSDIFLLAAEVLADVTTKEEIEEGRLFPAFSRILECSYEIAVRISEHAYEQNIAALYPKPEDLKTYICTHMYHTDYNSSVPDVYQFPR